MSLWRWVMRWIGRPHQDAAAAARQHLRSRAELQRALNQEAWVRLLAERDLERQVWRRGRDEHSVD